jgi:hypothetical protein
MFFEKYEDYEVYDHYVVVPLPPSSVIHKIDYFFKQENWMNIYLNFCVVQRSSMALPGSSDEQLSALQGGENTDNLL